MHLPAGFLKPRVKKKRKCRTTQPAFNLIHSAFILLQSAFIFLHSTLVNSSLLHSAFIFFACALYIGQLPKTRSSTPLLPALQKTKQYQKLIQILICRLQKMNITEIKGQDVPNATLSVQVASANTGQAFKKIDKSSDVFAFTFCSKTMPKTKKDV